ncbi:MAG: WYL domain-containing protein [Corynebacterium sp.]|nr:WYL domain-containing protein [Corynebacterium sp.]
MARRPTHEKLVMLVALIPYATAFGDRKLDEIAADFKIPRDNLDDLIQTLTEVRIGIRDAADFNAPIGLADYDSRLELAIENDELAVLESRKMDIPLRMTLAEATTVLANLSSLAAVYNSPLIHQVIKKLSDYITESFGAVTSTDVAGAEYLPLTSILFRAMMEKKQVSFTYRNKVREVSVIRIFNYGPYTYATAWDEASQGHRNYRLDRIEGEITITDSETLADLHPQQYDASDPFRFSDVDDHIIVDLKTRDSWVLPQHEVLSSEGDTLRVKIPVADEDWLQRYMLAFGDFLQPVEAGKLLLGLGKKANDALIRYQNG